MKPLTRSIAAMPKSEAAICCEAECEAVFSIVDWPRCPWCDGEQIMPLSRILEGGGKDTAPKEAT